MFRRLFVLFWVVAAIACGYFAVRQGRAEKKATAPVASKRPAAKPAKAAPMSASATERAWVERWMKPMTVRDMAAQLIVITSYGEAPSARSAAFREFRSLVRDLKVGGIIVVNRVINGNVRNAEPYAMAAFLNRMQKFAKVPLLAAADFERGASMRVAGTVKYPHLMAYGAAGNLEFSRQLGLATAREARALGIHWVFAPVADVQNNPENPVINIRSYGEDPKLVADHVRAFIEGAHSDPKTRVLTTVKHFPGHGDTAVDSHMGLAKIDASKERMQQVELVPFKAAIAAGVDSIMTAHMAVPAIEKEEIPATVSGAVLTDLLRKELGYQGIIVTDAMDMAGLAKQFSQGEAAVKALEAGADVLLMPTDPEGVVKAVAAAVKSGRLSRKRLEQSVAKVLAAKVRVGLHRNKLVNLEEISDVLESNEASEEAQLVADRAITLVRGNGSAFPLKPNDNACVYLLTESRYGQQGRTLQGELQKRSTSVKTILMDPLMPQTEIDALLNRNQGCATNVVAAFVTAGAYRGNVGLTGNLPSVVEALQKKSAPMTLFSIGNPYLLKYFPDVPNYLASYSTSQTSEVAAAKAILGEITPKGKLPVSIPGLAKVGDGL
jgi:beta-N-acetylhexosaminidase